MTRRERGGEAFFIIFFENQSLGNKAIYKERFKKKNKQGNDTNGRVRFPPTRAQDVRGRGVQKGGKEGLFFFFREDRLVLVQCYFAQSQHHLHAKEEEEKKKIRRKEQIKMGKSSSFL
jgi:hypothetical protein